MPPALVVVLTYIMPNQLILLKECICTWFAKAVHSSGLNDFHSPGFNPDYFRQLDLFTLWFLILRVLAMTTCTPEELRFRGVSKCRRSCCLIPKEIRHVDFQTTLFKKNRTCSMCKTKYYATNVQCLLGNFNCVPAR